MKTVKISLAALALAAGALTAAPAFAWHHHGPRVVLGFNFGFPAYYPAPYYPAYYPAPMYYPAPVVVQQAPTAYVQQAEPAHAAPSSASYWYYCAQSRTYYPYVKDCPGGWQRVSPTPPG